MIRPPSQSTYALTVRVVEGFKLNDVWVAHDTHDLQLTVLPSLVAFIGIGYRFDLTLNRLSCNTLLIAASSPFGASLVWKTTPNEPFPTILHCVYCISRISPVRPSWTFSRTTSILSIRKRHLARTGVENLTSHAQACEASRATQGRHSGPSKMSVVVLVLPREWWT